MLYIALDRSWHIWEVSPKAKKKNLQGTLSHIKALVRHHVIYKAATLPKEQNLASRHLYVPLQFYQIRFSDKQVPFQEPPPTPPNWNPHPPGCYLHHLQWWHEFSSNQGAGIKLVQDCMRSSIEVISAPIGGQLATFWAINVIRESDRLVEQKRKGSPNSNL